MSRPIVAGLVMLLLVACSGEAEDCCSPDPGPTTPAVLTAGVERVIPAEGSPLIPGTGDERLELAAAAATSDAVVAVGRQRDATGERSTAAVLRTTDGREWAAAELPDPIAGGTLAAAVAAGDDVLAFGNDADGRPAAVRVSADGAEPVELPFPQTDRPASVRAAAGTGDRILVAAVGIEGTDDPRNAIAALHVLASDDDGATWTALELPDELRVVDTGPQVIEQAAPGQVGLIGYDGAPVLSVGLPGSEGVTTTLWRGDAEDDAAWVSLGTDAELFEGETVDLLHGHGDTLLAFTRAGTDAAAWRSDDGGGTFARVDSGPAIFGGGGRQSVDAAVTLESGALVVAGRTEGETFNGRRPSVLELWVSENLETWRRSLDDPALAGSGRQQAAGLAALGDQVVVVGNDQRRPTEDEADDAAAPLATHGASWLVGLAADEAAAPPVEVAPLEVTGFAPGATITRVAALGDGLIAAGSVGAEDEERPAAWTSADGIAWTPVESPALQEATGVIEGLTVTEEGGVVAVGQVTGSDPDDDDDDLLGVWTSPDGAEWTRADLTDPVYAGAVGYAVTQAGDAIVAVGTSEAEGRGYRDVGIWRSTDLGATWAAVPTAEAPFRAHGIEVLFGVGTRVDGTVVAVGHYGEPENTPGGGFRYSPQAYALESADGQTWSTSPMPFDGTDFAELLVAQRVGADFLVAGTAGLPLELPNGDGTASTSGVARADGDDWAAAEQRFRSRPAIRAAVPSTPAGTVLVGSWWRPAAGQDPLIAFERDGALVPVDGDLLDERDVVAVGAAELGEQVVVLGADTTEDASVVVGWSITAAASP
ncbi:hypothetical protein [Jiangella endophytica]|uniref:hypothetical protein n=1 Tax=Jiangella endophytica TaxID=1623398 RepID=UPI0013002326|nr:hypothetical protein [Jiangella endophytica]